MFYIAFRIEDEPLMTMGDAVASFLEREDHTTKNMCLATVKDSKKHMTYEVRPRQWTDTKYRWKDVTSVGRRAITACM
jgi:hypothetical protein